MISSKLCRKISASIFSLGNAFLFATSYSETNLVHLISSLLFMSCSIALYLSSYNHKWLFYGGLAVVIAYFMVSFSNEGDGTQIQYLGGIFGMLGGSLIFRGALQRETGKQYKLFYPLNLADLYPLATAGVIEGGSAIFIAFGSFVNKDISLFLVALFWFAANMLLIISDEYLRKKLNF